MRKRRRKPHPRFPGRDTRGRMMKGCASPKPFARGIKPAKREGAEKSPEPELVTSDDIDRELVQIVSRRKYLTALKHQVEAGEPLAVQRYERALAAQREAEADEELDLAAHLSRNERSVLRGLLLKAGGEDVDPLAALYKSIRAEVAEEKAAMEAEEQAAMEAEEQAKKQEQPESEAESKPDDPTPDDPTPAEPVPDQPPFPGPEYDGSTDHANDGFRHDHHEPIGSVLRRWRQDAYKN